MLVRSVLMGASSAPPVLSGAGRQGVARLESALRSAQFDTVHVSQAVGAQGPNLTPSAKQVPIVLQRLPDRGPLWTLIRLFVAGVPVPAQEAVAALAPLDSETAAAMNLLTIDGGRHPMCPHRPRWPARPVV